MPVDRQWMVPGKFFCTRWISRHRILAASNPYPAAMRIENEEMSERTAGCPGRDSADCAALITLLSACSTLKIFSSAL